LKAPALVALVVYWFMEVMGTHAVRPELILPPDLWDKFLHGSAYAGLTVLVLVNVALRMQLTWRRFAMAMAGLAVVAILDEVTQPPFGRHTDWLDWIADVVGMAAGSAVVGAALMLLDARQRRRAGEELL
jgi:VanZ family protein